MFLLLSKDQTFISYLLSTDKVNVVVQSAIEELYRLMAHHLVSSDVSEFRSAIQKQVLVNQHSKEFLRVSFYFMKKVIV